MDAAVHRGAPSLPPPLPARNPSSIDGIGDALGISFAATMPVYDDTEGQDSDVSRLHGDDSARSSSVTTPDLPKSLLPPPPPPPVGFKPGNSPSSTKFTIPPPPPPPPLNRQRSNLNVPPPPPPKSSNGSIRQPSRTFSSPPFPPPPISSSKAGSYGPPFPPPPPPPTSSYNVSRENLEKLPGPPPPPPPPLSVLSDSISQPSDLLVSPARDRWQKIPPPPSPKREALRPPSISASDDMYHHSNTLPIKRRMPRQRRQTRQKHHGSASGSSTYSYSRPEAGSSSGSDGSSEEDPIVQRNARQFPPLLPAAPGLSSSASHSRASFTNRITSWVAHYERTQSPRRELLGNGAIPAESEHHNEYDSDVSSEGEIEMLWTQLKDKRSHLNRIKHQMTQRRKELRDLRRQKDNADNAFMSVIRPFLVNQRGVPHGSIGLLDRRLADMQNLRTEYHFLESNYEGLEVMLDEEEGELYGLETRFFSLLATGRTKVERPPLPGLVSDHNEPAYAKNMPYDLIGISPEGPREESHPLYRELVSTVGDLENAREDHEDLLYIKEQYELDVDAKRRVGKKLTEEETEFFAEFPSENVRMRNNVINLEESVKRLRDLCLEKGAMKKHLTARMAHILYPGTPFEDMELDDKEDILKNQTSLAHERFPELLSQPDHILADGIPNTPLGALKSATRLPNSDPAKRVKVRLASKELAIDRLMQDYESSGKADFVNRWLLQQLRTSPMNARLLYSTFISTGSLKIRDFWRWQSDVLYYWWRDSISTTQNEGVPEPVTREESEYASRVGTPLPSRAASEGGGLWGMPGERRRTRLTSNSDAQTIHG